jgi:hypothetical protein
MFKKADIVLGIILLALGFGILALLQGFAMPGQTVTVFADGELYGVYSLYENQTVEIESANGHNTMEIKGGQVSMIDADCPNKDCIKFGSISQTNQTIICLPNKVSLKISGESDLDAITY